VVARTGHRSGGTKNTENRKKREAGSYYSKQTHTKNNKRKQKKNKKTRKKKEKERAMKKRCNGPQMDQVAMPPINKCKSGNKKIQTKNTGKKKRTGNIKKNGWGVGGGGGSRDVMHTLSSSDPKKKKKKQKK